MDGLLFALTLYSALASGLVAGIFFGFSTFIMGALARIPAPQGIAAMQSINIVVINPLFLTAFMGTGLTCLLLAIASLLRWHRPGSGYLLTGAVLYIVGTIVVTFLFNIPLNNALANVDPASTEGARVWADYVVRWTNWNTVRTIAPLAAAALLTMALWHQRS